MFTYQANQGLHFLAVYFLTEFLPVNPELYSAFETMQGFRQEENVYSSGETSATFGVNRYTLLTSQN